jgi:hypothetical protein
VETKFQTFCVLDIIHSWMVSNHQKWFEILEHTVFGKFNGFVSFSYVYVVFYDTWWFFKMMMTIAACQLSKQTKNK